ncbi:MAG: hypothetical protein PVI44_08050 [Balneolaceae bacterium]|jgi:hypothetical protein
MEYLGPNSVILQEIDILFIALTSMGFFRHGETDKFTHPNPGKKNVNNNYLFIED